MRGFLAGLPICLSLLASPASGFDWQQLIPPPGGDSTSDDTSATGSAGTRGIDEGGAVASRGRDRGAVEAIERAESDEAHVAKFIDKGGLQRGTAPGPEPRESSSGGGSSGVAAIGGALVRGFDSSGYGAAALQTAKGMAGFSPAEEHELGRRIAAQVLAQYGLYRNHDAEEYANLVAAVVGRSSDRPELHYHVGLLDTDQVNAFSAPGGYLFVTRGAIALLRDEAELAGVLGHEIGHVTERHVLRELQRANVLGGALSAARSSGFTLAQYGELTGLSMKILSRGLDRKDELAADEKGATFAARAGYGAEGLKRFLARLGEQNRGRSAGIFPTHPPADDRLASLERTGIPAAADRPLAERFGRFIEQR